MAYEFVEKAWLDKDKMFQVFLVAKNYVTIQSCFPFGASWCQWLDDVGWEIYTTSVESAVPYRNWSRCYITNIKRKVQ